MADEEFDIENELPQFLNAVLDKAEKIIQGDTKCGDAEVHAEVVYQCISLLRSLSDSSCVETSDKAALDLVADAFSKVLSLLRHYMATRGISPTVVAENGTTLRKTKRETPGRPHFEIPAEMLEELRALGFSWTKIGAMLGVSRWTIHRRVAEYGLQDSAGFHHLPNEELDNIIKTYMENHGTTSGQAYVAGHLRSLGFRIQR